jgi:glycosyltransferase involved in cell wall biosynthesis
MAVIVYAHDGDSVYDLFFLNHLLKNNEVYLLTFSDRPTFAPQGVHVVKIPEPFHPATSPLVGLNIFLGSFLRAFLLKRRLNQVKHDLLISNGGLLYGFYSALSKCWPSVLFIWGSDVLVAPKFLPFRFMAKYSLKKASAVVVDSDVQERACVALGCDPKKIVKFPWVDLQSIRDRVGGNQERRNMERIRDKVGWKENGPLIISTRQHKAIYNIECLIQAIPHVVKEIPTARFLILGKGNLTETLRETAARMGVDAYVKFLGDVPVSEIPEYLEMADIYVSTSLSDGTSASLIEAMVCKLPAIVTDIPGNQEWIKDGSTGLLFPVRDYKALAERIVKLSRDEDLRNTLAEKAYQTVSEKANWQKNSKLLDELISSMVTFI